MSDHWFVDPGQLVTSSSEWGDQADTLDGSARRVAEADTSGFPPDVVGAASTFTQRWSAMVGMLRTTSEAFEEKMLAASQAYVTSDVNAQETFEDWLLQMGQDHR